jgi:hypothetical protein
MTEGTPPRRRQPRSARGSTSCSGDEKDRAATRSSVHRRHWRRTLACCLQCTPPPDGFRAPADHLRALSLGLSVIASATRGWPRFEPMPCARGSGRGRCFSDLSARQPRCAHDRGRRSRTTEATQRRSGIARSASRRSSTSLHTSAVLGVIAVIAVSDAAPSPGRAGDSETVDRVCRHRWLPEGECVRLGAGLEERDLKRPLADRAVLPHELIQAPLAEQPVPVLLDVDAV